MFVFTCVILLLKLINTSSSSDLSEKPTLMVAPVTEGEEATLTCMAPSLCSDPEFAWMWAESGGNTSSISNNKTENEGPKSTLSFPTSAKHHGSEVTCQVTCSNQTSAEAKVTLNVTYAKKPEITGTTTVSEGDSLDLTCTVDSFPPSVITWTKDGINKTLTSETGPDTGKSVLVIYNMTAKDSGHYFCTAKHQNSWLQSTNVTVMIQKKLEIIGERAVLEGQSLSLTCSFNSSPPPLITWTKLGFNTSLINGTGAATLFISNMTAEKAGQYLCTAEHLKIPLSQEVDVKVKYVRKLKITGESTIKEGDLLNLTCTVDSFPPSLITWTKDGINKTLTSQSAASNLVIQNVTAEDAGRYFCTAKYQNVLMQDFNISVIYQRSLSIIGETSVTEGHVLNLTCNTDSWPLSSITWTKLGLTKTLKDVTGAATPVIYNLKTEDGGEYICKAKHLNKTLNKKVNVTIKEKPEILNESSCEARLDILTCVCISKGRPLPSITWLLLENYAEYSLNTEVSPDTVKSTVSLTEKEHNRVSAVCVSRNENGKTERKLIINKVDEEGQFMKLLRFVTQLGTIIPFLIGVLFSALLCLSRQCCRKKEKANGSPAETLEMVMVQENSPTNSSQGEDYEQNDNQRTARGAEGVEAAGSDVEYSDIKLLVWGKNLSAGKKQKDSFTEYAKIKPTKAKQKATEEEKEEEEVKLCPEEVAEGEEIAVYSNVTELMDQMQESSSLPPED